MQKRLPAIIAAACILLAHLVSLRHETTVAHVRDTAGVLEHAHALAEYHAISTTQHLHGREDETHPESGSCALLVGLEQTTILATPPSLAVAIAAVETNVDTAPLVIARELSVLAFAPKTSPPAIG